MTPPRTRRLPRYRPSAARRGRIPDRVPVHRGTRDSAGRRRCCHCRSPRRRGRSGRGRQPPTSRPGRTPSQPLAPEVLSARRPPWPAGWETFSSRAPYREARLLLLLALVSKLSTAARRLVLGRPFRSDRLSPTLLPQRIALPVFAFGALASGAVPA